MTANPFDGLNAAHDLEYALHDLRGASSGLRRMIWEEIYKDAVEIASRIQRVIDAERDQ